MTQNTEKVQRKELDKKCKPFSIVKIDIQFFLDNFSVDAATTD